MKKENAKKCFVIFINMLYVSSFTFGGGFVIATFIKKRFIDKLHMLEEEEMLDFIALGQSAPGAIAVNTAMLVGWRISGLPGMLSAMLGTCIPPIVILSVISLFYAAFAENRYVALFLKGMQAGVAAVIADVTADMCVKTKFGRKIMPTVITAAAFIAVFFFKINVIAVILTVLAAGTAAVLITWKKEKKA